MGPTGAHRNILLVVNLGPGIDLILGAGNARHIRVGITGIITSDANVGIYLRHANHHTRMSTTNAPGHQAPADVLASNVEGRFNFLQVLEPG